MKSVNPTFIPGPPPRALNLFKPKPGKSLVRNVIITWVTVFMSIAPIIGVRADGGAMVIQYEFSLNKKAKFRQLNFAYQDFSGLGAKQSTYTGETARPGVVIPLYSMDTRSPGLINLLFTEERQLNTFGLDSSESNDSKKGSTGVVLLLVGVMGGLAYYAISEAKKGGCSDGEIGLSFVTGSDTYWCED
jgi:hypothetical protein